MVQQEAEEMIATDSRIDEQGILANPTDFHIAPVAVH